MSAQTTPQADAYLRTQVMTASPEQLRLMLLDGAIKFARRGLEGFERADIEASYEGVSQCRAIVGELLSSIRDDPDPELARQVRSVYMFLFRELMDLGFDRDQARMRRVIELLEYERETWAKLLEKLASEQPGSGRTASESHQPGNGAAHAAGQPAPGDQPPAAGSLSLEA